MKRRLKVDLDELSLALESDFLEASHFLDPETGRVVMITDEWQGELERIYQDVYDKDGNEPIPFVEALQQRNLPDWEKEVLLEAHQVEENFPGRFIRLEQEDPHADYRDMEEFIETVEDERLQDRFWRAIRGRGAFRYFKDVLEDHPREKERWYAFQREQERQRVLDWLEEEEIEPILDGE